MGVWSRSMPLPPTDPARTSVTCVRAEWPPVWRCWECSASFTHGRMLAGHLVDFHGAGR